MKPTTKAMSSAGNTAPFAALPAKRRRASATDGARPVSLVLADVSPAAEPPGPSNGADPALGPTVGLDVVGDGVLKVAGVGVAVIVGSGVGRADDGDGDGPGGGVSLGSGDRETDGSGSGGNTSGSGGSDTSGSGDSDTDGSGSGTATLGVAIGGSETWTGTSTAAAAAAYDPSTANSPQHTAAMAVGLRCPPISPSFATGIRDVAGFTSEIDGWSSRK